MIPIFFTGEEEPPMSQSILQDRDGFHVREGEFTFPDDTWNLDPQTKRAVTICNLFVNYHYGISDIVRVLDESRRNVILALLKNGIIRERRVRQAIPSQGIERRKTLVSLDGTSKTPKKTILSNGTKSWH
jgi:hypothetical protein